MNKHSNHAFHLISTQDEAATVWSSHCMPMESVVSIFLFEHRPHQTEHNIAAVEQ